MFMGILQSHAHDKKFHTDFGWDSSPLLIVSQETQHFDGFPNAFYPNFEFAYYSNSPETYQLIRDLSIKQSLLKKTWSKTALILLIMAGLAWALGKNRQNHSTEIHHLKGGKKWKSSSHLKLKEKALLIIGTNQQPYLVLKNSGYSASYASENDNIPERLNKSRPNYILLDLNMSPEKSKLILSTIRSMDIRHQIKIVAYGGSALFSQKLWALFHGADEYIFGSINPQILENHLFTSWHHLGFLEDSLPVQKYVHLKKQISLKQFPDSEEDCFVEKVFHAILEHYEDENFNIDELAALVNQSRSNLYRKVKEQTGRTPNNLIRLARITKSAHLLAAKSGTVSEIAYSSGFSSLSYFSKVFTASFGISPSTYMESH
ncbi:helix-turn-helix domain-containing protein [Echinicola marina]|uniref:response regulator transcription factor n=1 Tax=Echinicola marina TaxID=2859768 RepID=UPI001CF61F9C|nr:DNA-binding response regulator [Echinicola marina]UCS94532.1 helix-turn-helix domain-containing protein [Echinicola marina]